MKILALIGSPRKGGNTDILVEKLLEGCEDRIALVVGRISTGGNKTI